MDDAFEIIVEHKPNTEDDGILREVLHWGSEKVIVEQEDIDVNISEPQEVDGPIIEDYFCEGGVQTPEEYTMPEITTESFDNPVEGANTAEYLEKLPTQFSINSSSFHMSQNLSASVCLMTPLHDLTKPIIQRRNSLPILRRERNRDVPSGCNLLFPKPPDRSRSTPVQSPSTVSKEGGEIENALALPSNGLNLLEDDISNAGVPVPPVPDDQEEVDSSKGFDVKSAEDVGSSHDPVEFCICFSTQIDVPPDMASDLSANFMAVAGTSFTIQPVYRERKIYMKFTDMIFAMIVTTILFWSYQLRYESHRLRTHLSTCEQTVLDLHSTRTSNFSYIVD